MIKFDVVQYNHKDAGVVWINPLGVEAVREDEENGVLGEEKHLTFRHRVLEMRSGRVYCVLAPLQEVVSRVDEGLKDLQGPRGVVLVKEGEGS